MASTSGGGGGGGGGGPGSSRSGHSVSVSFDDGLVCGLLAVGCARAGVMA